ncbi:MAG: C-terminal binding protein [Acidobacteria bacterium]|jgi:D-3-phosphoglycerate dehydrogenase|nr:C-terminal binding protein [Acidobacteriota bacterium]
MQEQKFQIVITDHGFPDVRIEQEIVTAAGFDFSAASCKTSEDVITATTDADGLLVQWAPITREVISKLKRCKIIVRYGVGVDNVDLEAAKQYGIAVCNVPDYCVNEVADHSMALAMSLVRQLGPVEKRLRSGTWKIVPVGPMPACREMLFVTAGYGRTAQAVLRRAKAFEFQVAACDPFTPDSVLQEHGVRRLSAEEMFAQADVLSLHCPLSAETRHLVNAQRLAQMKRTAILVNTARGELIDTQALADALNRGLIAYAGLDVFEKEPLPPEHPLFGCANAQLTSHVAWFSESSLPTLRRLAAEEAVRGLQGVTLRHRVA